MIELDNKDISVAAIWLQDIGIRTLEHGNRQYSTVRTALLAIGMRIQQSTEHASYVSKNRTMPGVTYKGILLTAIDLSIVIEAGDNFTPKTNLDEDVLEKFKSILQECVEGEACDPTNSV